MKARGKEDRFREQIYIDANQTIVATLQSGMFGMCVFVFNQMARKLAENSESSE